MLVHVQVNRCRAVKLDMSFLVEPCALLRATDVVIIQNLRSLPRVAFTSSGAPGVPISSTMARSIVQSQKLIKVPIPEQGQLYFRPPSVLCATPSGEDTAVSFGPTMAVSFPLPIEDVATSLFPLGTARVRLSMLQAVQKVDEGPDLLILDDGTVARFSVSAEQLEPLLDKFACLPLSEATKTGYVPLGTLYLRKTSVVDAFRESEGASVTTLRAGGKHYTIPLTTVEVLTRIG